MSVRRFTNRVGRTTCARKTVKCGFCTLSIYVCSFKPKLSWLCQECGIWLVYDAHWKRIHRCSTLRTVHAWALFYESFFPVPQFGQRHQHSLWTQNNSAFLPEQVGLTCLIQLVEPGLCVRVPKCQHSFSGRRLGAVADLCVL